MQMVHQSLVSHGQATSALPGLDLLKNATAARGSQALQTKVQMFVVTGHEGNVAQEPGCPMCHQRNVPLFTAQAPSSLHFTSSSMHAVIAFHVNACRNGAPSTEPKCL